jgi:hypothetical protein
MQDTGGKGGEDQTVSEALFERFCRETGIQFRRLNETIEQGGKTPDYELFVDQQLVVTEVKQLDPNEQERRVARQLNQRGCTEVYSETPGRRVREKINSAMPQLKARAMDQYPALLILYDNTASAAFEHGQPH